MSARAWVICSLVLVFAPSIQAQDVFYFVDERGVSHFSNVPRDARYQLFIDAKSGQAAKRDGLAALSLELTAPASIQGNADVPVLLSCPGCISLRGWADVTYDPGTLTLADASTAHHRIADGQIRVEITGDGPQSALSTLLFSASARARAPTTVSVVRAEFRNEQGQLVEVALPSAALIVIAAE